jgi:hypothetical protein
MRYGALDLDERVMQGAAEERDSRDDHDRYQRDHDAVFNGGGAVLVAAKTGSDVTEGRTHECLLNGLASGE